MTAPAFRGRRDNGLDSESFAAIADVDPRLADHLLDVLGLRDVPAYVEPTPADTPVVADRLYVAAEKTTEARTVLNDLASELGIEVAHSHNDTDVDAGRDLLDGIDTDAEFSAIVSGLGDLGSWEGTAGRVAPFSPSDQATATPPPGGYRRRRTDRPTARPQADSDEDHFTRPDAPPLPRISLGTLTAVLVTILGVLIIALGSTIGLTPDLPLPLGVATILVGAGLLLFRLRPNPRDDSDGDGAVV